MYRNWSWALLSGAWVLAAILNIFDRRSSIVIGYDILAAVLFAGLGVTQYFCDKKGEKGKKIFNWICIAAAVLIVLSILLLLIV